MILHPAIIALVLGSALVTAMLWYAGFYGIRILSCWDIGSGSELQLELERRTYLISTMLTYALGFQLLSFFLFIYTADHLAKLFVGAMCAAGTLYVNEWGYPTILLKLVNFVLAGLWLVINCSDNRAYDYPLIKKKYALLILVAISVGAEMLAQSAYFLGLKPDIITSCCGTLFTTESESLAGGLVGLPPRPLELAFCSSMAATIALGVWFYVKGRGGYLFSVASLVVFLVSTLALITFISIYFYELPTHHCPFCILHEEYRYVGYPLYLALMTGVVSGLGVGITMPFKNIASLREILPRVHKSLTLTSVISYLVFTLIVAWGIVFSNLKVD